MPDDRSSTNGWREHYPEGVDSLKAEQFTDALARMQWILDRNSPPSDDC